MKDRDLKNVSVTPKEARDHLKSFGLAVVPIKPSPEMLIAAIKTGGMSTEVAWNIYKSMVDAFRGHPDYVMAIERHFQRDVGENPPQTSRGSRARTP